MSGRKIFGILFCAVLAAAFLGFFFVYPQAKKQKALLDKRKTEWFALEAALAKEVRGLKGKSGIVIKDLGMNWEISFYKERLFPSASLVKIPIMAAVFKAVGEGKIDLKDTLKLKNSDKVQGSGDLKNRPQGSIYSVEELLRLMIISSDNTATNMLIELLGFQYLNKSFEDFGLKNTNLSRKMMEFESRKKGIENYTTAEDMAYILEAIYRNKLCNSFVSRSCLELLKKQRTADRIPARLPAGTIVAHKTGLELKVCHDTGIVFAPGGDFLICVLTKGVVNSRISKNFISNIALRVYNCYR